MADVWRRVTEFELAGCLLLPVLVPRRGALHELLVHDHAKAGPDAARRAEIGNAAFGADAGPVKATADRAFESQPAIVSCAVMPSIMESRSEKGKLPIDLAH